MRPKAVWVSLAVGLLIGARAVSALGVETKAKSSAPAKPPELKILERFAGTWDTKTTNKVAEWTPKEERTTGTTTNKWVLGGRFMQCQGKDSLGVEFIGKWTYDTQKKAYRTWFFNSAGTALEWSGTWDEDAKAFVVTNDLSNGITGTLTMHVVDKDTVAWSSDAKDADGKVYHAMEGRWSRRK